MEIYRGNVATFMILIAVILKIHEYIVRWLRMKRLCRVRTSTSLERYTYCLLDGTKFSTSLCVHSCTKSRSKFSTATIYYILYETK